VPELRELDLQLAFAAACALREDVEDEAGAVDDAALERCFEVALLHARQRVVEDDEVGVRLAPAVRDLLDLAPACERGRVRPLALPGDATCDGGACRRGQRSELGETVVDAAVAQVELDEQCAVAAGGALEQGRGIRRAAAPPRRRSSAFGVGGVVVVRHRDRARRHHRRDGVLVDHLRDRVLQQHDVLVERLDLALQLDAVDEIDRDLHMLLAQRVQERVL
jgi:hypothetical protein